jgi:photosystem II stability/assembly factor-like uncharacterized protein
MLEIFCNRTSLYLGTDRGLFQSTDQGQTWNRVSLTTDPNMQDQFINSIYVEGETIYASDSSRGFYMSKDGGKTWALRGRNNGMGFNQIFDVIGSGSAIFCATDSALMISTDEGLKWVAVYNVFGDKDVFVNGAQIYLASSKELFYSLDGGSKFIKADLAGASILSVSVDANKVYAGTNNGLFVSNDAGYRWTKLFPSGIIRDHVISGSTIYAASEGGLYVSKDGGTSWALGTSVDNGLASNNIYKIRLIGTKLFLTGPGGLSSIDAP